MSEKPTENTRLGSNAERSLRPPVSVETRGSNGPAMTPQMQAGLNTNAMKTGEASSLPKPSAPPPPKKN